MQLLQHLLQAGAKNRRGPRPARKVGRSPREVSRPPAGFRRDKPPEEIREFRNKHLRPELVDFFQWAHKHYGVFKDQRGLVTKAFGYATRHEAALMRFLNDGRLCIDNNHSERAIRVPPAEQQASSHLFSVLVIHGQRMLEQWFDG